MRLCFLIFICFISSSFALGQLKIVENTDAQDLINELLGDTENIKITNAKVSGGKKAYGIFKSNLKHNLFFNQGIILTNGLASNAIGPNNDSKKSAKLNFISDPDINEIAERKGCYDTVLFEFDLISKTDEIQFKYFFASEEYPEYVKKNVNDVFIFLVTNLSTKSSENIAILNGDKNIPITVDHINLETNSDYYIANAEYNKIVTLDTKNKIELSKTYQYDGFTKVLVAKAKVVPNVKYHLKLGISDVGDQLYDSAIFLEANSLKSTGKKLEEKKSPLLNLSESISIDYTINFKIDAAQIIGDNSFKQLDEIVSYLIDDPTLIIKVIGHTDNSGTNSYNDKLSNNRAIAVKEYLVSNGIDTSRIIALGMGENQPKSELKSENRRVQIVFSKIN